MDSFFDLKRRTKIQTLLKVSQGDSAIRNLNDQNNDWDKQWNYSLFIARIIEKSIPYKRRFTKVDFLDFLSEYEKTNSVSINTDLLFEKYWLRDVFDEVLISGDTRTTISRFENIMNEKQETVFLVNQFEKYGNEEVDNLVSEYPL